MGKFYYDLLAERDILAREDVALVRVEQLYPFPYDTLQAILEAYPQAKDFVWCQEEPSNQGAWFSHRHRLQIVLDRIQGPQIRLISRKASAAHSVGINK